MARISYRHHIDNEQKRQGVSIFIIFVILLITSVKCDAKSVRGIWIPVSRSYDTDVAGLERCLRGDSMGGRYASKLLDRLQRSPESRTDGAARVQTGYWKAERAYSENSESDDILRMLDGVGEIDSLKMPYEWFRVNYLRLKVRLYQQKDYKDAYGLLIPILEHSRRMGYKPEEARTLANLGLLFQLVGDVEESAKYFTMARSAFSGLGTVTDSLRNELNLCNALSELGRTAETVERLVKIETVPYVRENLILHCNVLLSLYEYTGEYIYAEKAYEEAMRGDNIVLRMKSLGNMSDLYLRRGEVSKALAARKEVYNFFRDREDPNQMEALRGIVDIYRQNGPADSTLKYLEYLVAAQDTFSRAEILNEVGKIRASNEIRSVKTAVNLAEARTALERRKGWIVIIVAVALLLLAGMWIFYTRRKNASERKLELLEKDRLSISLRNERLENERKQLEIDGRNREVASKALIVLKKNGLLNDLLAMIAEAREKNQLPVAQSRALERKIRQHLNAQDDWNDFTLHFEHVHPDFFNSLKQQYPSLTDKDMKLCAYLRLGLTTKQIAQMMSVLPESVNTSRYRLRRKMGLAADELLEDTIRNIKPGSMPSSQEEG